MVAMPTSVNPTADSRQLAAKGRSSVNCCSPISEARDTRHERTVAPSRDRADTASVGERNYLVEGVSGTGKTSVCRELNRRGYHAINGDRDLAYQVDPETGEVIDSAMHEHHIWDVSRVQALVAEQHEPVTFFCGGSRNFLRFIDLFDEVFVLDVDLDTLHRRLDQRPRDEWGSKPSERDLIVRLHRTKEDIPRTGVVIDATPPLAVVVDEILSRTGLIDSGGGAT
jgi:hypothetical protein